MQGLVALWEEGEEEMARSLPREDRLSRQPGRGLSPGAKLAGTWTLDFSVSRRMREKRLTSEPTDTPDLPGHADPLDQCGATPGVGPQQAFPGLRH